MKKKLSKEIKQTSFSAMGPLTHSYPVDFPNRCAQKLLDKYFSVLIKRERNTAKQQEGLLLAVEATDKTCYL